MNLEPMWASLVQKQKHTKKKMFSDEVKRPEPYSQIHRRGLHTHPYKAALADQSTWGWHDVIVKVTGSTTDF